MKFRAMTIIIITLENDSVYSEFTEGIFLEYNFVNLVTIMNGWIHNGKIIVSYNILRSWWLD